MKRFGITLVFCLCVSAGFGQELVEDFLHRGRRELADHPERGAEMRPAVYGDSALRGDPGQRSHVECER